MRETHINRRDSAKIGPATRRVCNKFQIGQILGSVDFGSLRESRSGISSRSGRTPVGKSNIPTLIVNVNIKNIGNFSVLIR